MKKNRIFRGLGGLGIKSLIQSPANLKKQGLTRSFFCSGPLEVFKVRWCGLFWDSKSRKLCIDPVDFLIKRNNHEIAKDKEVKDKYLIFFSKL